MIKQFKGYNDVNPYGDYEPLPKGGYVLKILAAKVESNSIGEYIKVSADVTEGDFKGFYAAEYQNQQGEDKKWHCHYLLNIPKDDGSEQDGWTQRKFKTFTNALEESNSGYHFDWDEQKFKGLVIGGLFNEREYEKNDGTIGRATNWAQVCNVQKIREGKFKVPADKVLANVQHNSDNSFVNVPDNLPDELPFN